MTEHVRQNRGPLQAPASRPTQVMQRGAIARQGLVLGAGIALLVIAAWLFWQLSGGDQGVEPTGVGGADGRSADVAVRSGDGVGAAATGDAATAMVRDAETTTVRLVLSGGEPFPDGAVGVVADGAEQVMSLRNGELDGSLAAGGVTLRSLASPPLFAAHAADLRAGRNVLTPLPLAQLRLRYQTLAGHECTPHPFDCATFAVAATDVEAAVARRVAADLILGQLQEQRREPLASGVSVPCDGSVCVLASGADVVRVAPAHAAWFGSRGATAGGVTTGGMPQVGGSRTPVTEPLVATPGDDVEVTIVLEPAGSLELVLVGWPQRGRTSIVLRRAGGSGAETVMSSWKTADRRVIDHSAKAAEDGRPALGVDPMAGKAPDDRVVFDGLMPGVYRVDAYHLHGLELTCALLVARVEASGRTSLELARGIGRQQFMVARGKARGAGNLMIQGQPKKDPALDPDVPATGNLLTARFDDWPAGDLTVVGFTGTRGTLSWFGTAGRSVLPFDLARASRFEFR